MAARKHDAEAHEEKRLLILAGVAEVIAKRGVMGVTMKSVAEAAGVSQGLLHYYFADKDAMMLAMIRESSSRLLETVGESFESLGPGDDVSVAITREYRRLHEESPDYFSVFAECWPMVWASEAMREGFKELYGEFKERVRTLLALLVDRCGIKPVLPAREAAAMVTALCDGMELQLRVDPDLLDDEAFWNAFTFALRPLMGQDRHTRRT